MDDLERFCEMGNVPAASLDLIFSPYGVKDIQINSQQFTRFFNDDFPIYDSLHLSKELTERQTFILSKFLNIIRTKFGATLSQRWNSALTRNPPSKLNTTLKLSALCHLFQETNLPFSVSEFVDALFVFYGEKFDEVSFAQFGKLFSTIQ